MLQTARDFTEEKMLEIRAGLEIALANSDYKNDICIVVTGSYGRQEASNESDLDWYIIFDKDRDAETIAVEIDSIKAVIQKIVLNEHGDTGTFGAIAKFSEMQSNIGGENDTNQTLTRRMLFLLEGDWLYNKDAFENYRKELLLKYIKESDAVNSVPRFLLNDIIRYYRTIATDFEYKVSEKNKDWGLRNIKLKFSRKLIYFSGVLAVAELYRLEYQNRIERAVSLFSTPPIARIKNIASDTTAIAKYEKFLEKISSSENRDLLKGVTKETRKESELYQELNELSLEFSNYLHNLIKERYPEDHPLQHDLVF